MGKNWSATFSPISSWRSPSISSTYDIYPAVADRPPAKMSTGRRPCPSPSATSPEISLYAYSRRIAYVGSIAEGSRHRTRSRRSDDDRTVTGFNKSRSPGRDIERGHPVFIGEKAGAG